MPDRPAAIVTGAASGIGLVFAKRLIDRGYRVVLADIDSDRGIRLQNELGQNTLFIQCDVSDWSSQVSLFKTAYDWAENISVFLANAGVEENEPFYSLQDTESPIKPSIGVLEVDLHSVVYGLRLFRHHWRKVSGDGNLGKFIATNSMAGLYEFPAAPIYSAAKHGVVGLVRSSSNKLRKTEDITINAISPGPVNTEISSRMKEVVAAEDFTPFSRLLTVLDKILDEDITGQIIECTSLSYFFRQPVPYADSNVKTILEDMKRIFC